jgi:sulfite reductase (ferredoxin)
LILDDYDEHGNGASFANYYAEKGEHYFYDFLKPLTAIDNLTQEDFIDWGTTEKYKKEIGIGECAGVVIDLIATLLFESEEKIQKAEETLAEQKWAASIYHSYASMVNSAKALLTAEKTKTNTHASIIKDFDEHFVHTGKIKLNVINPPSEGARGRTFEELVLQLNKNEPSEDFAKSYLTDAKDILASLREFRKLELQEI